MNSQGSQTPTLCGVLSARRLLSQVNGWTRDRRASSHIAHCPSCRVLALTLMELRLRWRLLPSRR